MPQKRSARNELGLAFGTKKSQKAIKALTANAIQTSPSQKQSSPGKPALDPLANAVISSMADTTASMPSREEMQAEIDSGKPRPRPNMHAETPADVYPVNQLVGGDHILRQIAVKEWIDKTEAGEDVQTRSRFVACRLKRIVQSGDVKKVRLLKYILLLIEWHKGLKTGSKRVRKVPKPEKMASLIEGWGSDTVHSLEQRFAENQ